MKVCTLGRALWYVPVIPVLGRLRQKNIEFQARLSYRGRLGPKNKERYEL
jgi:hypothetical protein